MRPQGHCVSAAREGQVVSDLVDVLVERVPLRESLRPRRDAGATPVAADEYQRHVARQGALVSDPLIAEQQLVGVAPRHRCGPLRLGRVGAGAEVVAAVG